MLFDDLNPFFDRPRYHDRTEAGRVLATHLGSHEGRTSLVLGIPRGGVVVAAEVARRLDAELDIVVARKLGAPGSPELAVGAVTADGGRFLNTDVIRTLRVPDSYLEMVTRVQMEEAQSREGWLRGILPAIPVENRTVIVVDDGFATGATVRAAVRSLQARKPARVVVAAPVGSREACAALGEDADEVVCPYQPEPFGAVGLYYVSFEPVDHAEVQRILQEVRAEAF